MSESKEIPAAILDAVTSVILEVRGFTKTARAVSNTGSFGKLLHLTSVKESRAYAEAALEAAGVPDLIAERDRLAFANAGSWSLYQECATANEGLAAENRQLLARIAKLEAALHKVIHSQDVAMPIELDEEITKLLSAESVEVSE